MRSAGVAAGVHGSPALSPMRRARAKTGFRPAYTRPMPPQRTRVSLHSRETLPIADALRRELYFFSLYRVFEAALLALVLLVPSTQ